MWYLCFKINPLSIYSLQPVVRFAPSCSLADCSARWSRPRWITSYGITGTAPCSLTSVTYRCLHGCWCLCLRWWWWWSTKLWSCMRYGMKTRLKEHWNHKEPNLCLKTGDAHFACKRMNSEGLKDWSCSWNQWGFIQDYFAIGSICDLSPSWEVVLFVTLCWSRPHVWSLLIHCRVRVRYQKRQKLQFETKLGMNSPFWLVPPEDGEESVQGTSRSTYVVTKEGLS